jgi:hypothetical protein
MLVVLYHLIILHKAHSRNLRHNIEHRKIVGSSPSPALFVYGGLDGGLPFFFYVLRGFFFLLVYAHNCGVLDIRKHVPHHLYHPFFFPFPRGVVFCFFGLLFLYHTET